MYDYLIVGSGISGATFAHEMHKRGKKVLVLEQRNHIAGNIYTKDVDGINIHVYGPHCLNTNKKYIWDYVNQFANFNHFVNRPKAYYKGKIYSLPINMQTFYDFWGVTTPAEAESKLKEVRIPCDNPSNLEDWVLSQVGSEIYEALIRGYTTKQWMRSPKDLPSWIIKRLPLRYTYDDNYYNSRYQGIPIGGYTQIIEKMLDGIEVKLSTPFEKKNWRQIAKKLFYSGCIDEFYDYRHGELEYRSLRFETKTIQGDFQGNAIINYTDEAVPYTRIIEHKHFEFNQLNKSVITYEYPTAWDRNQIPYYPVNTKENDSICHLYKDELSQEQDVIACGRLASYKYINMDDAFAIALKSVEREVRCLN